MFRRDSNHQVTLAVDSDKMRSRAPAQALRRFRLFKRTGKNTRALVLSAAVALAALVSLPAQTPQQPAQSPPLRGADSVRWEAWSAMRSAAPAILGWKIGVRTDALGALSFYDAAAAVDREGLGYFEGFGDQLVNDEIPKKVAPTLAPGETEAVKKRLTALNLAMTAYRFPTIGADENEARQLFQFARILGVETIVSDQTPASMALVERLAEEYSINVATRESGPQEGVSSRIGVYADTAAWIKAGTDPIAELNRVKSRLLVINIGANTPRLTDFLREMYRLQIKPSLITVTGSLEEFEKALQPVLAQRVDEMSKMSQIRGPERLTAEVRERIDAALPTKPAAIPKKPRKLLVLDLNVAYNGHASIPAENYALDQIGKRTGAWEAVFSNDLDNLKSDKIWRFDAVYLNNTVGMIFVDPQVREGMEAFVRNGGGLAGNHGTSHASMDWPEFHDMIGVVRGIHREATEKAWIKIDDPGSPLTVPFHGEEFLYMDEFFRFPTGPYSRSKLHVLLSMDVEKTDMNQGRACQWPCVRPDHDYAVSWIRDYGKGRVFFTILGHQPTLFTVPALSDYFMRGIQFILGDLDADATPSAEVSGMRRATTLRRK